MENSSGHAPKASMQPGQRAQLQGLRAPPGSLQQQTLVAAQQRPVQPGLQPGQQGQHSSMVQSPHQANAAQSQSMIQPHPHPGLYSSVRPMYNQSQQTGFPHHMQHQSASSPRTVGLPVTGSGQTGGHPTMLSMQNAQQQVPGLSSQLPSSQQAAIQARLKAGQGMPTQLQSGSSAYGLQSIGGMGSGSVNMQQFGGPSSLSQQSMQQQQQWSNHLKQPSQQSVPSPSYQPQYIQQRPHGQPGQQQAQQHQPSQLQSASQPTTLSESQSQSLSQPQTPSQLQSQSQPQASQSYSQFQSGPQSLQQPQQPRMQPTPAAKPSTLTPGTPAGIPSSPAPVPERRILGKRSLQDLVQTIDQNERLDPDVEDVMLEFADHFIETVTLFACELAKHRKSDTLEAKDVLLNLERNWQITIPGFGSDEYKAYKRPMVIDVHKQRVAMVRRSQALGQPSASEAGTNRTGAQTANSTMPGKIFQNGQTAPSVPP